MDIYQFATTMGCALVFIFLVVAWEYGWIKTILWWLSLIVFGLSGLAACFAMIASVIHFQILWAVGYFVLMLLLWFVGIVTASALAD